MLEDLLHAGRRLDGSKTWFQKETLVLLLAPESSEIKSSASRARQGGTRGDHGQECEERGADA